VIFSSTTVVGLEPRVGEDLDRGREGAEHRLRAAARGGGRRRQAAPGLEDGCAPVSGLGFGHFEGKVAIEVWWRRCFDRMAEIRFTPVHVAFANPFGFSVANTVFTQLAVDMTTKDGLTAHADVVNVSRLRGGKIVEARDYLFDPAVEAPIWGRVGDPLVGR
jgi:ketosteroid isomerase-like protein